MKNNSVRDNVEQSGSVLPGGGIVLLDSTGFGGRTPNNNHTIRGNTLNGNAPLDIFDDGSGHGNSYSTNSCSSSNNGAC